MNQGEPITFLLNMPSFKRRIITKYILLLIINISILVFGYFNYEDDKTNYISMSFMILVLIVLMFLRNGKKQLETLSKMYFEISGNILKQYGANNSCTEIELDKIISLKLDNLLGYKRILLISESGKTHSYSRIIEFENFISSLEKLSAKKIEKLHRNKWELIAKTLILYSPTFVTFYLSKYSESKLNTQMAYLIFNLNTMFFIHNISEKKFEGGLPGRISRRLIIILFIYFLFQFYKIFFYSEL